MSQQNYSDWERRKKDLMRSVFVDDHVLSPIPEAQESSSNSSPLNLSPEAYIDLPELIIEKEPQIDKHDEPPELYKKLEKKIVYWYRKLFYEGCSDVTSMDSEMGLEMSANKLNANQAVFFDNNYRQNKECENNVSDNMKNNRNNDEEVLSQTTDKIDINQGISRQNLGDENIKDGNDSQINIYMNSNKIIDIGRTINLNYSNQIQEEDNSNETEAVCSETDVSGSSDSEYENFKVLNNNTVEEEFSENSINMDSTASETSESNNNDQDHEVITVTVDVHENSVGQNISTKSTLDEYSTKRISQFTPRIQMERAREANLEETEVLNIREGSESQEESPLEMMRQQVNFESDRLSPQDVTEQINPKLIRAPIKRSLEPISGDIDESLRNKSARTSSPRISWEFCDLCITSTPIQNKVTKDTQTPTDFELIRNNIFFGMPKIYNMCNCTRIQEHRCS